MDDLETNIKRSKMPRFVRNTALIFEIAAGIFLGSRAYAQHTLTVQAYNQQGSALSGAQVTLETKLGRLKAKTNSSGVAYSKT